CMLFTIGTFATTLLIVESGIWKYSKIIYIIFTAFSLLIIVLTPVESNKNKIPAKNARQRKKRVVVIIFLIDVLSIVITYNIKVYFMLMAAVWSGLTVTVGRLYYNKEDEKDEKNNS
ncbi:MAG: accessory gene regulator B family protein, partial [Eubacteriales bacterium]|nr:accessory gene regulator B family protein [Eubacteriales bacterium]